MKKLGRKILEYPAVFDPAIEGGYNVLFPAFPGCVTFGRNFEEAKKMAKEALELWLEELTVNRQKIPLKTHRPIIDDVEVFLPARR